MPHTGLRIIVSADWHLGEYRGPTIQWGPYSNVSCRLIDIYNRINEIIDHAVKVQADAILFCGDMFRDKHPATLHLKMAANIIKRIDQEKISLYAIIGNHDISKIYGQVHALAPFMPLLPHRIHILDKPHVFNLTESIRLLAFPYCGPYQNAKLRDFLKDIKDKSKLDILMLHGTVEGCQMTKMVEYEIVDPDSIRQDTIESLKVVFAGHIHAHQRINNVWYPGSVERLAFDEEYDKKGFLDVIIDGSDVLVQFIELPARKMITLNTDDIPKIKSGEISVKDSIVRIFDVPKTDINEIRQLFKDKGCHFLAGIHSPELELQEVVRTDINPKELVKTYAEKVGYKGSIDSASRVIIDILESIP